MYTTEMVNTLTPTSRFFVLTFHSQHETDSNLSSRREINFLLGSCSSNPVHNIPMYMMITQRFNVCSHD